MHQPALLSCLYPKSSELSCKRPASTHFNFLSPKLTCQSCKYIEVFWKFDYILYKTQIVLLKTKGDSKTSVITEFGVKNYAKKKHCNVYVGQKSCLPAYFSKYSVAGLPEFQSKDCHPQMKGVLRIVADC
jgi:hypothetical protein